MIFYGFVHYYLSEIEKPTVVGSLSLTPQV